MTDEHVDLLAQTICAAYWQDNVAAGDMPIWSALSPVTKGQWRRAARAAMRTLEGNAHWFAITPASLDAISGKGG